MISEPTIRRVIDAKGVLPVLVTAAFGAGLLCLLAPRLLDHTPFYDELYHVLGARGVLATGQPVIDSGAYPRAEFFTRVVALALQSMGDNLISARLPALVSTAALVALVGGWCCYRAGWLAGAMSAALLATAPSSLSVSVHARFYSMHALLVGVMLIAVFELLAPGRSRGARMAFAAIALLTLPLAYHLQSTTIIALGAGVLGCLTLAAADHHRRILGFASARPLASAMAVAGAVGLGLLGAWQLGLLEQLGETPLWAADSAGRVTYYNTYLVLEYPLLWPLLPLASLAAAAMNRRLGLFCIAVIVVTLAVHSIAAQKAVRYVYYALPFICVLWGCGFRQLVVLLARAFPTATPAAGASALLGAFLLAAFTMANSIEGQRTAKLLLGRGETEAILGYRPEPDWSVAAETLRPHLMRASRVIVSSGVKGIFHLGRYDYELNASVVLETESRTEFGRDSRTGRRAISTAQSVTRVLDEPGATVVVIEDEKVDNDVGAPRAAVDVIRARCAAIAVPRESRLFAWACGA